MRNPNIKFLGLVALLVGCGSDPSPAPPLFRDGDYDSVKLLFYATDQDDRVFDIPKSNVAYLLRVFDKMKREPQPLKWEVVGRMFAVQDKRKSTYVILHVSDKELAITTDF